MSIERNRKKLLVITLAVVGGVRAARAAEPAAPAETKQIARLVGDWKGMGSMTLGSEKVEGIKVQWTCRSVSEKWGVRCDAVMVGIPGIARYEETDLFGFDPGGHQLHWFAVTNAGETHDHVGTAWTGQAAKFVYDGVQEGKPFKEVIDVGFRDPAAKTLEIHAETFVDGKLASVLQARARR